MVRLSTWPCAQECPLAVLRTCWKLDWGQPHAKQSIALFPVLSISTLFQWRKYLENVSQEIYQQVSSTEQIKEHQFGVCQLLNSLRICSVDRLGTHPLLRTESIQKFTLLGLKPISANQVVYVCVFLVFGQYDFLCSFKDVITFGIHLKNQEMFYV